MSALQSLRDHPRLPGKAIPSLLEAAGFCRGRAAANRKPSKIQTAILRSIARRVDPGIARRTAALATSLLRRTIAWDSSQNKT